jgi:glycosyltransferase involved in cell wall biosynthesis
MNRDTQLVDEKLEQPARRDETPPPVQVSVVVPISERNDDLREIYLQHARALADAGRTAEFVFVADGPGAELTRDLDALKREFPEIQVLTLNRWFGEATALAVGFDRARGEIILTLASYFQVEPAEIGKVLRTLDEERADLVVTRREPRIDAGFNRLQSSVFHGIVRRLTGTRFRDIACGVRAMRRRVAQEINLYGDLHRFIPLLAYERGFKVVEIAARQSPHDSSRRVYRPGVYLRRLLDILTLFFLFKFLRKPLRFFGLVGSAVGLVGAGITAYLGIYRLLGLGGIAGRPLLILGVLLLVLGAQLFSIGLLGEIIIFTHAQRRKDYSIDTTLD